MCLKLDVSKVPELTTPESYPSCNHFIFVSDDQEQKFAVGCIFHSLVGMQ